MPSEAVEVEKSRESPVGLKLNALTVAASIGSPVDASVTVPLTVAPNAGLASRKVKNMNSGMAIRRIVLEPVMEPPYLS